MTTTQAETEYVEAEVCWDLRRLDRLYCTTTRSPFHHDNRCPIHGQRGAVA